MSDQDFATPSTDPFSTGAAEVVDDLATVAVGDAFDEPDAGEVIDAAAADELVEAAEEAGMALKNQYQMLQVQVYDAATKTRSMIEWPAPV